jgi:predicted esterase
MAVRDKIAGLDVLVHAPDDGQHPLLLYLHGIGEAHDQSARGKEDKPLDAVAVRSPLEQADALGRFVIVAPQMAKRGDWQPHLDQLEKLVAEVRHRLGDRVSPTAVLAGFSKGGTGVLDLMARGKLCVSRWCAVDAASEPANWWQGPAGQVPHAIINGPYGLRGGPVLPLQSSVPPTVS